MERSVEETIAGGTWILLGNLAISLSGFVYWLLAARLFSAYSLGVAASIVSAAMVANALLCSGMNIAIMREVARLGPRGVASSMIFATLLGAASALLAMVLARILGYPGLELPAAGFAGLSTVSLATLFILVGLRRFRSYFLAVLSGVIAKLGSLVVLWLLGIAAALAIVVGYVMYPAAAMVVALILVAPMLAEAGIGEALENVRSVALLSFSNYPYAFAQQLITVLGVYIFALVVGRPVDTGGLYISLMIVLAVAGIAGAFLSASLPVSMKLGGSPFEAAARLGVAICTALALVISFSAAKLLGILNPQLAPSAPILRILAISIPSLVILVAGIMKLNCVGNVKSIAAIGILRLVTLVALVIPLLKAAGVQGVAYAYLASAFAPLPIALKSLENRRTLAYLWLVCSVSLAIAAIIGDNLVLAMVAPVLLLVALHVIHAANLSEYLVALRTILRELGRVKSSSLARRA